MNKKFLLIKFIVLFAVFQQTGCVTYRSAEPIPSPATPTPYLLAQPIGIYHMVESGQTLWAISRNYGVSVSDLMRYNNIRNSRNLTTGERLFIPTQRDRLPVEPLYVSKPIYWRYIIIHHSATDIGSAGSLEKGHKRRGFWQGLGYHFVVDNGTGATDDGDIEVSRRWFYQMEGAHCNSAGMNRRGIGICLVGNFDKEIPTEKQLDSLIALVDNLRRLYNIPLNNIIGHKDVPGAATRCPGENFPWGKFKKEFTYHNRVY